MSYISKLLHLATTVQFRLPSPRRGHAFAPKTHRLRFKIHFYLWYLTEYTWLYSAPSCNTLINYSVPEINGFRESNKTIQKTDQCLRIE